MQTKPTANRWLPATLLTLPLLALTLAAAQQSKTFAVSGLSGTANVIQVEGRNYVEVEALARLTNGSLSFNGSQIVLALPNSGQNSSSAPAPSGFSKEFLNAGIEAMAQVREWRTALKNGVETGLAITDQWMGPYRAQAQQSLRLAGVAVNTDSDRNALPLLTNEFNNMRDLSQKYLDLTKSMTYVSPDSFQSDPMNQKVLNCAHSLATMASNNQVVDDGSCH